MAQPFLALNELRLHSWLQHRRCRNRSGDGMIMVWGSNYNYKLTITSEIIFCLHLYIYWFKSWTLINFFGDSLGRQIQDDCFHSNHLQPTIHLWQIGTSKSCFKKINWGWNWGLLWQHKSAQLQLESSEDFLIYTCTLLNEKGETKDTSNL